MSDDGKTMVPYYGESQPPSVTLSVYDVSGRRICSLTNDSKVPGYYRVSWDATDDSGRKVAAGSYFCRLCAKTTDGSTVTATTRMVLLE
jgi:flagellar hook assembly protein FlgD